MPETETEGTQPENTEAESSEDLGDAGKKALAEERRQRRALEKQLKDLGASNASLQQRLKEFDDRDKSEIERAHEAAQSVAKERDSFKSEADKLRILRLRDKISATKGLDPDLWDRVIGDNEEEISADVERLVEKFSTQPKRLGALRSGASAPDGANEKQKAAAALRGVRRD